MYLRKQLKGGEQKRATKDRTPVHKQWLLTRRDKKLPLEKLDFDSKPGAYTASCLLARGFENSQEDKVLLIKCWNAPVF